MKRHRPPSKPTRRQFIQLFGASGATVALQACGAGGGSTAAPAVTTSPTPTTIAPGTPVAPAGSWLAIPPLNFVRGVAATVSLSPYMTFAGIVQISLKSGSLPAGVTFNAGTGSLVYDGVGAAATATGIVFAAGVSTTVELLSPAVTINIANPISGVTSFKLTSTTGGTLLPFTIGQAFRKGQVPTGSTVVASIPDAQVIVKNRWQDGSLKFALVSGRATIPANTTLIVTLSQAAAVNIGNALTTADLRATGAAATIGCGSFGSVSWQGGDWDSPFMTWVSGPQMSSWLYRKQVGSDPTLVGWLEVRLYAGGAVDVLPWVENGYLKVAGASNKNTTFSFTLGGTQRFSASFDLAHHCRTVLVSGTAHSHWLGTDPAITPKHDRAYLQSTRVVPAYRAEVSASSIVWSNLPTTFAPLQQGNYSNEMGQGGYAPAIGLIPEWDVLYLTSDDPRAYSGVIFHAYGAGRYGIHFRDEKTNKPLRMSAYPNLLPYKGANAGMTSVGASTTNEVTPASSGTTPPSWDTAHHPSLGYTAYLLTGRYYFVEELQFSCTVNFLKTTDHERGFGAALFVTTAGAQTVRGAAWSLRTLTQAACITPDEDTVLRNEFNTSLSNNIGFYHGRYVAQPNNPQGFVEPYSNYTPGSGVLREATWQHDFFTGVIGFMADQEGSLSATAQSQLQAFFQWTARCIVFRLGSTAPTDYLYRDAAEYTIAISPIETPDFKTGTGPWYATWGDIYKDTLGTPNPGVAGDLRGGYFPDGTSYWGFLQPAIAYAVQNKVPGAAEAYARMTGAPNWSQILNSWNLTPVWSVKAHD